MSLARMVVQNNACDTKVVEVTVRFLQAVHREPPIALLGALEEANVLVSERRGGRHFKALSISGTVLPEFEEERWQKLSQAITVHSSTFPVTVHSTSSVSDQELKIFARVFLGEKGVSFVSWREI